MAGRTRDIVCICIIVIVTSGFACDTVSTPEAYAPTQAIDSIKKTLAGIDGYCSPRFVDEEGPCAKEVLRFVPQKATDASIGQRILIMDGGMTLPALTRYRSRVLDFFDFTDESALRRIEDVVEIPRAGKEILVDILDQKFSEMPPCLLKAVQDEFQEKLWDAIALPNQSDHGDIIFTKLAELNPHAQFVLIHDPHPNISSKDCGDWSALIEKRRRSMVKERDSVLDVIEKYGITHINLSMSPTFEHRKDYLKELCATIRITEDMVVQTIQDDLDFFFAPIFAAAGVTTAQAILTQSDYSNENARKLSVVDCTQLPKRVRIGVFGTQNSEVLIGGSNDTSIFRKDLRASIPCMDLAVNIDSVLYSITGVETFEAINVGTSWAAPIALSYLLHLGQLNPQMDAEGIISLAAGSPQRMIRDPVKHKQFEIYRLGYLQ